MDFKCPPVCYNVELSLMYTILYVVLTYAKQTSENNHIKKMMIPLGQCKTIVPNLNSIFKSISYIRYWKRKIRYCCTYFSYSIMYLLYIIFVLVSKSALDFSYTHNCFCWYHPVSEKTNFLSVVIYVFGLCWRTRLCRVKRYWLFIFFVFSRNKKSGKCNIYYIKLFFFVSRSFYPMYF